MAHDKYTRRQKYISTDGGLTFNPVTPPEYIKGQLIEADSVDCGAEVITWVPVEDAYICEIAGMYRWVTVPGQYSCVGFNKMNKEKEQVSYNSGVSWEDTGNTHAGSTLIEANSTDCGYVPTPYSTEYLTTEALGSGNISLNRVAPGSSRPILGIQYSKNGGAWESYTYDTDISVVTGDKIRWKGTKNVNNYNELYSYFRATADYKAYGNPLSLLKSDSFVDEPDTIYEYAYYKLFTNNRTLRDASGLALPATTLARYCYYYMFQGCTRLTTAPALPAMTLADHCYYEMFWNCISLTTAPALPATTLAPYCYDEMFYYCKSLTIAPELPATTLADGCYISMFQQCTSLTTAPALPATTLSYMCYNKMFYGCTSLTTAPALPATTLAQQCYNQMFSGCTSLTTAPALPAATLANHCCHQMFYGCTSLTNASELPSTTLAEGCYYEMFYGCTSLTTAPELPATTLASECYRGMFDGCTNLNYIKCRATNISAYLCTYFWVRNIASSGTFVKESSMTDWTTGISGIPNGWTVQNT